MFAEREDRIPDDEMIEDANVEQGERVLQSGRDQFIRRRGFRGSGRMAVGEECGGGMAGQGFLHDFTRVHGGLIDRAAEEFDVVDQLESGAASWEFETRLSASREYVIGMRVADLIRRVGADVLSMEKVRCHGVVAVTRDQAVCRMKTRG